jgi:acetylornithine/succinyldiaminopimelate/putrescine aminotransferase
MLACEHEGIRPDMILLGKALSGGGESTLVLFVTGFHTAPQCTPSRRFLRTVRSCTASSLENTAVHTAGASS